MDPLDNRGRAARPGQGALGRRLTAFSSLGIPAYRFLLLDNFFNMIGFQARLMAQAWLVLELTNSDAGVGLVNGLPAIPVLALSIFGGVLADRLNRRVMLVWTRVSLAALGLFTAALISTGAVELWHLIVLAFFVAVAQTLGVTVNQTMIVDIVGRQRIFGANALFGVTFNFASFVGPAIGGLIIARAGVDAAFYIIAGVLVIAALAALGIRVEQPKRAGPSTSFLDDLGDGIKHIATTPILRWLLLLSIAVLFSGIWMPLLPRYARDVLDTGPQGYGAILAAQGVGGLFGVVTVILAGEVKALGRTFVASATAYGALMILFAFSTSLALSAAIGFGFGFIVVWWAQSIRTAFQVSASYEMRGRVMSLLAMITQVITLAWLVGGVMSELVGPRITIVGAGVLSGGIYLAAYVLSPEVRRVGLDAAPEAAVAEGRDCD